MDSAKQAFVPIILGTDLNAYGMARSFYEKYTVKSELYAMMELAPTRFSKIVTPHFIENFKDQKVFKDTLLAVGKKYRDQDIIPVLISCGDDYTEFVAEHRDAFLEYYVCPYTDADTVAKLTDKESFYRICDEYGLPYPHTKIINSSDDTSDFDSPFGYPVVLKGADANQWRTIHFDGYEKAFTINDKEKLNLMIHRIFEHGYVGDLILQDYVPGDDSNMRTINIYADQYHHVKMMVLGHPLLEDPSPLSIGNYVAIAPGYDQDIYDQLKNFLEKIEFTGFVNFDVKYDRRDNSFKVFDLNPRQGRSSFFTMLNGYNFASLPVEDYIFGTLKDQPTVFANKDTSQYKLWLGVSKATFEKYATDNEAKTAAMELIKHHKYGTTFKYNRDWNIRRALIGFWMNHRYKQNFDKYFKEKI